MAFAYTIASVVIVSLVSLVGVVAISVRETVLRRALLFLVAFSTGALIGDAFIHLLPELVEQDEISLFTSSFVLAGILFFFVLEKLLRWRHCHDIECVEHPKHLGAMNLFGDGFHNLIDGMLIASSYLVSVPLGLSTTLAVILHEVPQELGDFGVLLHSGFSKKSAIWYNFVSGSLSIAGALIAYLIGQSSAQFAQFMVPFTLGGFIYIALSGLIPELHKEEEWQKSLVQLLAILLGIGVMVLLLFFE